MTADLAKQGASRGHSTGDRLTQRLAEYASTVRPSDVPSEARDAAAMSLLDAVGVSLAATTLGEGVDPFIELVRAEAGSRVSTVFGAGFSAPAAAAAYVNGALAHALDYEDAMDGMAAHPNAQVIPAAVALAEERGSSGADLLTAIAVGCDVTCRLAETSGDRLLERGWYPPPLVGTIGATVAGAILLRLTPEQVADAISLALFQSSASGEMRHNPDSLIRGIRDAFASHAAVRGVQLAERGVRGFTAPLAGEDGFFSRYCGIAAGEADSIFDSLGESFCGVNVSYKLWPSCRGTHAFIDAALRLRDHVRLDEISTIDLTGAPVNSMLAEPLDAKRAPRSGIDAKFSLPFTVALALVDGRVGLDSFTNNQLRRHDLLSVSQKVTFAPEPSWAVPARMTSGRVRIGYRDGRSETVQVDSPTGAPDSALGRDALVAKFVECASHAACPVANPDELAQDVLSIGKRNVARDVLRKHFLESTQLQGHSL